MSRAQRIANNQIRASDLKLVGEDRVRFLTNGRDLDNVRTNSSRPALQYSNAEGDRALDPFARRIVNSRTAGNTLRPNNYEEPRRPAFRPTQPSSSSSDVPPARIIKKLRDDPFLDVRRNTVLNAERHLKDGNLPIEGRNKVLDTMSKANTIFRGGARLLINFKHFKDSGKIDLSAPGSSFKGKPIESISNKDFRALLPTTEEDALFEDFVERTKRVKWISMMSDDHNRKGLEADFEEAEDDLSVFLTSDDVYEHLKAIDDHLATHDPRLKQTLSNIIEAERAQNFKTAKKSAVQSELEAETFLQQKYDEYIAPLKQLHQTVQDCVKSDTEHYAGLEAQDRVKGFLYNKMNDSELIDPKHVKDLLVEVHKNNLEISTRCRTICMKIIADANTYKVSLHEFYQARSGGVRRWDRSKDIPFEKKTGRGGREFFQKMTKCTGKEALANYNLYAPSLLPIWRRANYCSRTIEIQERAFAKYDKWCAGVKPPRNSADPPSADALEGFALFLTMCGNLRASLVSIFACFKAHVAHRDRNLFPSGLHPGSLAEYKQQIKKLGQQQHADQSKAILWTEMLAIDKLPRGMIYPRLKQKRILIDDFINYMIVSFFLLLRESESRDMKAEKKTWTNGEGVEENIIHYRIAAEEDASTKTTDNPMDIKQKKWHNINMCCCCKESKDHMGFKHKFCPVCCYDEASFNRMAKLTNSQKNDLVDQILTGAGIVTRVSREKDNQSYKLADMEEFADWEVVLDGDGNPEKLKQRDKRYYTTHSTRRGGEQCARLGGTREEDILVLGRWKSHETKAKYEGGVQLHNEQARAMAWPFILALTKTRGKLNPEAMDLVLDDI